MSSDSDPTGVVYHKSSLIDMFQTRHNNMKDGLWVMHMWKTSCPHLPGEEKKYINRDIWVYLIQVAAAKADLD